MIRPHGSRHAATKMFPGMTLMYVTTVDVRRYGNREGHESDTQSECEGAVSKGKAVIFVPRRRVIHAVLIGIGDFPSEAFI